MGRFRKLIEDLRGQSEHVRFRAASIFAVIGGISIGLIWMFVMLPLQLGVFSRDKAQVAPPDRPAEQVVGARDAGVASPSPTPT